MALVDKITALAEQVAEHKGLRIYDLELFGSGRGKTLRIFIDRKDKQGVSLDDCQEFSKGLSLILDVEDPIDGNYALEVSSPGIERELKKDWHYAESVGQKVAFNLNEPLISIQPDVDPQFATRKKITGVLKAMQGEKLEIEFEGVTLAVPRRNVAKAHWVFDYGKKT